MFNRRIQPRVHPKPGEPIEAQISGDGFIDEFEVRDISTTGMGGAGPNLIASCKLNDRIEVVIKLPRLKPFVARGVIRHLTSQGMLGIEFTELTAGDRARLQQYVERRVAEGGAAA